MKKILLSVATIVALSLGAQAQTKAPAGDFKFGFKGGYNLSNIGKDVDGNKALSSFHIGGFAEIPISEKFAIQPEVLYSAQGAKLNENGYKYDFKLDYINVPILAKYYVLQNLSVEAGPQIGFLTTAKADGEDVKKYLKSADFALAVGASYYFTENIFAGARYNFGLTNVSKDSDIKIHNNVLQISVGYRF